MKEINADKYDLVKNLFSGSENVYPCSVADGYQYGRIYINSVSAPTCAFIWHYCGFAYIIGEAHEGFLNEVHSFMLSAENNSRIFLQIYNTQQDNFFSDKSDLVREERYCFKFSKEKFMSEKSKDLSNYDIRELDLNLISAITGHIIPSFSWRSSGEFLNNGKGFCLVEENTSAAVAFSAAVSSSFIDIGIETNEKYRGLGFASLTVQKMIEYILSENKTPVWECHVNNIASRKTAKKSGFETTGTHAVFKTFSSFK